jgi:hypothetical protein
LGDVKIFGMWPRATRSPIFDARFLIYEAKCIAQPKETVMTYDKLENTLCSDLTIESPSNGFFTVAASNGMQPNQKMSER